MDPRILRRPWQLAAVVLLAFLFATNVYRAATQAITHDEAVTWEWFLSGPFAMVFGSDNGNHHPLHTLACKLTLGLFGMSELSMRIPALLGGLLYFYALFRVSRRLFGEGFLFLLSVAFLSLNPFLLDYLSCARGYSAGLGFLLLAFDYLIEYLSKQAQNPSRLLNWAGVSVGLAIGVNVITIFPAGALAATMIGLVFLHRLFDAPEPEPHKKRKDVKPPTLTLNQVLAHFVGPMVAVGGFVSILPKRLVYLEVGYSGPPSLLAIVEGVVRPSLLHSFGNAGLLAFAPAQLVIMAVTKVAIPLAFAALIGVTILIAVRWKALRNLEALTIQERFLMLLGGTLGIVLVMIVASRYVFHVPYPEWRTVLYWIPLLGLACLIFVQKLHNARGPLRMAGAAAAALIGLATVQYATQFNTRYYAEWSYCAATKDMMAQVRSAHSATNAPLRLGVTWQLEPGVNFYRIMWKLNRVAPVFRESPDMDADYYLLLGDDVALVARRGLRVLQRDPISGSVLAAPRQH